MKPFDWCAQLVLIILIILILSFGLAPVTSAAALHLSDTYNTTDSVGILHQSGNVSSGGMTAGLFIGTLAELKNATGTKMLGLGGFELFATSQGGSGSQSQTYGAAVAFVPITVFDDIIQPFVGYNFGPGRPIVGVAISGTQAAKLLGAPVK